MADFGQIAIASAMVGGIEGAEAGIQLSTAARGAARAFAELGTPDAAEMAALLESNPLEALAQMESMGGFGNFYQAMKEDALNARANASLEDSMASGASTDQTFAALPRDMAPADRLALARSATAPNIDPQIANLRRYFTGPSLSRYERTQNIEDLRLLPAADAGVEQYFTKIPIEKTSPEDRRRFQEHYARTGEADLSIFKFEDPASRKAAAETAQGATALSQLSVIMHKIGVRPELIGPYAATATGVAGVAGAADRFFGGLGSSLVGDDVDDWVTRTITQSDLTASENQQFRTDARTIVSKNIDILSGEESGRISESERALAEEAAKILQFFSTPSQARGALLTLIRLRVMSDERLRYERGERLSYDVGTPEAIQATGNKLMRHFNLKEDEMAEIVESLLADRRFRE